MCETEGDDLGVGETGASVSFTPPWFPSSSSGCALVLWSSEAVSRMLEAFGHLGSILIPTRSERNVRSRVHQITGPLLLSSLDPLPNYLFNPFRLLVSPSDSSQLLVPRTFFYPSTDVFIQLYALSFHHTPHASYNHSSLYRTYTPPTRSAVIPVVSVCICFDSSDHRIILPLRVRK